MLDLFAHPEHLRLVVPWLLIVALAVRGTFRRTSDWKALGQSGRLRRDGVLGWVAAIACLVVALAQPRWGRTSAPPLPPGHDVVLLVDTSRSMGAEDAVPDRLGVAVEAAESLIGTLGRERGDRVAVAAFAGRGRLRCPLTANLGAAVESLRELRPGDVRPGGTDLGAGLLAALEAFDAEDHSEGRTIVVFSDGEDHAGRWDALLETLRAGGVIVHSVAVGDPEQGHAVPSGRGSGTLTYQGTPVLSRRDDRPFEALAKATGGAVVRLGLASADLGLLYRTRIAPIARRAREAIRPTEKVERFPIFVAAALGLGLWGSWPTRGRWPRPRRVRWALLASLAALGAAGDDSASGAIDAGRSAYAQGRFAEALAAFERAVALDPRGAVPRYDAGAALFRLERYDEALERYREARERSDPGLRTKVDYALGNTALALGDVHRALRHYDDCIASTAPGPDLDAVRRDAAINRRYAEEQARNLTTPPEPEGDANPPRKPSRSPGPDGQDGPPKGGPDSPSPGPASGEESRQVPPSGVRRTGGAGGSAPSPPRPGSPEDRLAAALENIREARGQQIDDESPPPDEGRKDW